MAYNDPRTGYLISAEINDTRFLFRDLVSATPTTFTEEAALADGQVTGPAGTSSGSFIADQAGNTYFVPNDGQAPFAGGVVVSVAGDLYQTRPIHDTGSGFIIGTASDDVIFGGFSPRSSPDGTGDDRIAAGDGDDLIFSGDGRDNISAGAGNDTVLAGTGNDTVSGDDGNDLISGGSGDDELSGLGGDDTLSGGDGNDELGGINGNDVLLGGAGDDIVRGGAEDDRLDGGTGNDTVLGGTGSDTIVLNDGFGSDSLSGGEDLDRSDIDVLDGSALTTGQIVTFSDGEGGTIGASIFEQFERVITGTGADRVTAVNSTGAITISTGPGADIVTGSAFGDVIDGGDGDDALAGNGGDDTLLGGDGRDNLDGGAGNDLLSGGAGMDQLIGGAGNDRMEGGEGVDTFGLGAGFGTDTIIGGENAGDLDNINAFTIGRDVNVVWTGTEAGIFTERGTANSATFSQIEGVITGSGNDSLDARGSGAGINVETNDGDDTIRGSSHADRILGGGGSDRVVLSDGFGRDNLGGGDGSFSSDVLDGSGLTGGQAVTFTGSGSGTFGAATTADSARFVQFERVVTGSGNDTVTAADSTGGINVETGSGADRVTGSAFDDMVDGGAGNDTLSGGGGADRLTGGLGNDTLDGGAGRDTLTGGTGFDHFVVDGSSGDVVTDFDIRNGADGIAGNSDTINLGDHYTVQALAAWNAVPGNPTYATPLAWMRADLADNGRLDFIGGLQLEGARPQDLTTENTAVICFAAGTLIRTVDGPVPIEDLAAGDLVVTRDRGPRPIAWAGCRCLSKAELEAAPHLRPIRISTGALGCGLPEADLVVSPQHRILVRSRIAQRMFGTDEVLVAARQLLEIDGIAVAIDLDRIAYHHILFDRHEIIHANGAETESLFTGPEALKAVGPAAREEILALFPQLAEIDHHAVSAKPIVPGRLARKLAERHVQNDRMLLAEADRPPSDPRHRSAGA